MLISDSSLSSLRAAVTKDIKIVISLPLQERALRLIDGVDDFSTELSWLHTYWNWLAVRWCKTQASSDNALGAMKDIVNKESVRTATPDRCTVLSRDV